MMEAGVLVGEEGKPLYWHSPPNRTSVSLPDSRDLWWDGFWKFRDEISGFAHSHPGSGDPYPSNEDITTFSGVELGLGRRLEWWIISRDSIALVTWVGPGQYDYQVEHNSGEGFIFPWLDKLREISYNSQS
mgnify:CR=1 FL=1